MMISIFNGCTIFNEQEHFIMCVLFLRRGKSNRNKNQLKTSPHIDTICLVSLICYFVFKVRSLRLRLMKTDRVNEATFHITSVQDDQSEIKMSSGNASIDLIYRQESYEDEGTIIIFRKLLDHDKPILHLLISLLLQLTNQLEVLILGVYSHVPIDFISFSPLLMRKFLFTLCKYSLLENSNLVNSFAPGGK